jgi:hypothetical protein
MTKRASAQRALRVLWNCDPGESEEEYDPEDETAVNDNDDGESISNVSNSNSDSSSASSDDDNTDGDSDENESTQEEVPLQETSRDGSLWTKLENWTNVGRTPNRNFFTKFPGIKPFAKRKIDGVTSTWRLLFTDKMVNIVQKCTIEKGRETDNDFVLTREDIEAFIGLAYMRGVLLMRKAEVHEIFSKELGCPFFTNTMSRRKFCCIMRNLRFDRKSTRRARVGSDLFSPIRDLFEEFVANSQHTYEPHPYLTVDEQLLPSKNRCKFLQYMANKPDKFGLKFWLLVDVKTKFCVNQFPYLGKDSERINEPVGQHVVAKLIEPYKNSGVNITADNFFSSAPLAQKLLKHKTTFVGTVRESSRSIPPSVRLTNLPLYQSVFFKCEDVIFVRYQCKAKKAVSLLSTLHCTPRISEESKKEKPEIIMTYNATKTGVDCLDQMVRLYSTKAATRRWPVCVFYDLLDKAALNSHVLYKEVFGEISRKHFILQLARELCAPLQSIKRAKHETVVEGVKKKRNRIICSVSKCRNKTASFCDLCEKAFCGNHGKDVHTDAVKYLCGSCQ